MNGTLAHAQARCRRGRGRSLSPSGETSVRRILSPLGFEHINLIGRYHFGLPDAVKRGALRPFRNPEDVDL
jgi:hypothetical protein